MRHPRKTGRVGSGCRLRQAGCETSLDGRKPGDRRELGRMEASVSCRSAYGGAVRSSTVVRAEAWQAAVRGSGERPRQQPAGGSGDRESA